MIEWLQPHFLEILMLLLLFQINQQIKNLYKKKTAWDTILYSSLEDCGLTYPDINQVRKKLGLESRAPFARTD